MPPKQPQVTDSAYVSEIANFIHPADSKWRTIAVLEAYFDESGIHDGSRVFALGGIVARLEQIKWLADAWGQMLRKHQISEFHSTDLESRRGIYEGISKERQQQIFHNAINVIGTYARTAFAGVVVIDDYENTIPSWAKKTAAFGDKYNFCFQMCLGLVMEWIAHLDPPMPDTDRIAFMFDQRERGQEITSTSYSQIKKFRDADDHMGTLAFDSRKRFLPLQAADLVAYETYKHLDNLKLKSGRPPRIPIKLLGGKCNLYASYFPKGKLIELVRYYERTKGKNSNEPWWPWYPEHET
jgi:hypothetical protein